LYVVCLGIDVQGPKGLGILSSAKGQWLQAQAATTTTQDPKIQEEIHRWTAS